MAITYNPYNWEIRPPKKNIKGIRKKDKNLYEVKMELTLSVTREELVQMVHDAAKEVTENL